MATMLFYILQKLPQQSCIFFKALVPYNISEPYIMWH